MSKIDKKCPFCGSTAVLKVKKTQEEDVAELKISLSIKCTQIFCGGNIWSSFYGEENIERATVELIERWNRREH